MYEYDKDEMTINNHIKHKKDDEKEKSGSFDSLFCVFTAVIYLRTESNLLALDFILNIKKTGTNDINIIKINKYIT